jgi:hypothetical protein
MGNAEAPRGLMGNAEAPRGLMGNAEAPRGLMGNADSAWEKQHCGGGHRRHSASPFSHLQAARMTCDAESVLFIMAFVSSGRF